MHAFLKAIICNESGEKTSHCLNNQNLPGRTYCQLEKYFREKWKVFALASSLLTFQKTNQHMSNAKTQSALSNSKTKMKVPTAEVENTWTS